MHYWNIDESIFKGRSLAHEMEASMELMKARKQEDMEKRGCRNGVWRSSQMRLGQHSRKKARGSH